MKDKFIGIYEIGYERVRLYLRSGSGADFYFTPDDKGIPIVKIGADQDKWRKIVGSALHEAQEFAMSRLGYAYYQAQTLNSSGADYVFMLTHEQFNECCERAAEFLATALPDLEKAWKKWTADKKKKGKK